MLNFLLRRRRQNDTVDIKFNEQSDPYLERIAREMLLQRREDSAKIAEQQKAKETK